MWWCPGHDWLPLAAPAPSHKARPGQRTPYPESRICMKCRYDSFDDLCSFKFRQWTRYRPSNKDTSDGFRVCLNGRSKKTCRRRATVCEQHCIVALRCTRSEFCTRRLISIFWGRPFRQARIFERIFLGSDMPSPQSKRCSDTKTEPGRDFGKFNDFV